MIIAQIVVALLIVFIVFSILLKWPPLIKRNKYNLYLSKLVSNAPIKILPISKHWIPNFRDVAVVSLMGQNIGVSFEYEDLLLTKDGIHLCLDVIVSARLKDSEEMYECYYQNYSGSNNDDIPSIKDIVITSSKEVIRNTLLELSHDTITSFDITLRDVIEGRLMNKLRLKSILVDSVQLDLVLASEEAKKPSNISRHRLRCFLLARVRFRYIY